MSLHLSTQTGAEVTPDQLIGTEEAEKQTKLDDAERSMKSLVKRMAKAGFSAGAQESQAP